MLKVKIEGRQPLYFRIWENYLRGSINEEKRRWTVSS